MDNEDLDAVLQKAFDESTRIYAERGFQRRIGFGKKPALISVDLANAWTRPGNPFTCEGVDERIIPSMQALLKAAHEDGKGYVVFCGSQDAVEASLEAGDDAVRPEKRAGRELIARPHPDVHWALGRLRLR